MSMRNWGAWLLAVACICGATDLAQAGGFNLFIGGGAPVYAPPVVYAPPPVVYAPPPVVYAPQPAYYGIGFYGGGFRHHHHGYPGGGWGGGHHHHHHHGHW
jgi:hypothetical protein